MVSFRSRPSMPRDELLSAPSIRCFRRANRGIPRNWNTLRSLDSEHPQPVGLRMIRLQRCQRTGISAGQLSPLFSCIVPICAASLMCVKSSKSALALAPFRYRTPKFDRLPETPNRSWRLSRIQQSRRHNTVGPLAAIGCLPQAISPVTPGSATTKTNEQLDRHYSLIMASAARQTQ